MISLFFPFTVFTSKVGTGSLGINGLGIKGNLQFYILKIHNIRSKKYRLTLALQIKNIYQPHPIPRVEFASRH